MATFTSTRRALQEKRNSITIAGSRCYTAQIVLRLGQNDFFLNWLYWARDIEKFQSHDVPHIWSDWRFFNAVVTYSHEQGFRKKISSLKHMIVVYATAPPTIPLTIHSTFVNHSQVRASDRSYQDILMSKAKSTTLEAKSFTLKQRIATSNYRLQKLFFRRSLHHSYQQSLPNLVKWLHPSAAAEHLVENWETKIAVLGMYYDSKKHFVRLLRIQFMHNGHFCCVLMAEHRIKLLQIDTQLVYLGLFWVRPKTRKLIKVEIY